MYALSDDARQCLRDSRLFNMESPENAGKLRNSNPSLESEGWSSPRFQRKPPVKRCQPAKKTLREIAMEQKIGNGHVPLAHASSAPSLLDPFEGNIGNVLHNSKSSSDINRNVEPSVNGGLLAPVGFEDSRTDSHDPFLELITQRHKPQQNVRQQNGST